MEKRMERLAFFRFSFGNTEGGKEIKDARIFLCEEHFMLGDEDYTDCIPFIIRHEIAEMWIIAKAGWSTLNSKRMSRDERDKMAHEFALLQEFEYAFKLGKAARLLEFIKKISSSESDERGRNPYLESKGVYEKIKRRLQSAETSNIG
ncbi:MAG: hypothetical protein UW66_C0056G0005 [Candidatus Moranbacteria bacterium GW2011_GWF1_44_4]|nr:MAG: hypothetical protein UW66_C0056G0005 [Candidatus Moranbacteria bacterium GW2011_GWF1_44_4]